MAKIKLKRKAKAIIKKAVKEEPKEVEEAKFDEVESSNNEDWFAEGDDLDETVFKERKRRVNTFRVSVKKDDEIDVTFISPKPLTYREHNVKLNGYFGNYYTCLEKTNKGRCPFCEAKITNPKAPISNSYVAKAFWVINHEFYTDKDGNEVKQSVRLLVMKPQSYNPMKKIISKHFGTADWNYRGLRVTLMRSSNAMSPNTGDSFHVVGEGKIPKTEKYQKTKKDLLDEIAPMDRDELLEVADYVLSNPSDDE